MEIPYSYQSIDYLVIGHLTRDLTPRGPVLGGTAAYAALTARAMGLQVGIVTAWDESLPLKPLQEIPFAGLQTDNATTFENSITEAGRIQFLPHVGPHLDYYLVPEPWRSAPIVHLGPVAQEVEPSLVNRFSDSFIGVTPQGWLREWNTEGRIHPAEWPEFVYVLNRADAAVISEEDAGFSQVRIEEMAAACKVFAVTQAQDGASVFYNGEVRQFSAPEVQAVDATGSGDIFATVFFNHYKFTLDPWESAQLAVQVATLSTLRKGLLGVPSAEEIRALLSEPIL
jgi:sugar/nucleoside kinase (ribokinase family)